MASSPPLWGVFIVAVLIMNACTTQDFNVKLCIADRAGDLPDGCECLCAFVSTVVNIATVVTLAFENGM